MQARVNEVKQVCTRFQKGQATAEDVLSVFERFEIVELLPDVADICPNPEHRDALIAAHLSSSFQGLPSSSRYGVYISLYSRLVHFRSFLP